MVDRGKLGRPGVAATREGVWAQFGLGVWWVANLQKIPLAPTSAASEFYEAMGNQRGYGS